MRRLRLFAVTLLGVVRMPGVLTIAGAATLLVTAAIVASLLPAARASHVDVLSDQLTLKVFVTAGV